MKLRWVATLVLILLAGSLSIIVGWGGEKEKERAPFHPPRAAAMAAKQSQDKVTVGVQVYEREEEMKSAFGDTPLARYGVLPVLVVVDNNGAKAVNLRLKVEFVGGNRQRISPTPPAEVPYLKPAKAPGNVPASPIPLPKKKNKLANWEVEGRAFAAKMVPAGESVAGFFYFQTGFWKDARLIVDGLSDAATGTPFIYFDIPFEP